MSNTEPGAREATRITCHVHHRMSDRVIDAVSGMGVPTLLMESGRSVRIHKHSRPFGLPGTTTRLQGASADILSLSVSRDDARPLVEALIDAGKLHIPGSGTIFAQDIIEYGGQAVADHASVTQARGERTGSGSRRYRRTTIDNLALLTCILSMPGSGEQLSREALELGTCVPIVTLGTGTGLRDLMGLLRITIPPEKDIVHLVVPAHDTTSIVRMLIETMKLNLPGRGIIYETPARLGMIDTRLRIGPQEHAASIDQIITAIDELKADTTWRARFSALDEANIGVNPPLLTNLHEITIVSDEGATGDLVSRALDAGAKGATTTRVRRLKTNEKDTGTAAREKTVVVVGAAVRDAVIRALLDAGIVGEDSTNRLQVLPATAAYTHTR
jgi:hypothetical protein